MSAFGGPPQPEEGWGFFEHWMSRDVTKLASGWGSGSFRMHKWTHLARKTHPVTGAPVLTSSVKKIAGKYTWDKYRPSGARHWLKQRIFGGSSQRRVGRRAAYRAFAMDTVTEAAQAAAGRSGAGAKTSSFFRHFPNAATANNLKFPKFMGAKWGARYAGARIGLSAIAQVATPILTGLMVADVAKAAIGGAIGTLMEIGRPQDTRPAFYHSQANMTMRQVAMQAIHSSQLQTRSAFGREASFSHM